MIQYFWFRTVWDVGEGFALRGADDRKPFFSSSVGTLAIDSTGNVGSHICSLPSAIQSM